MIMTEQTFEIKYFPDGIFPSILKDYEEHDKSCSSIPYMWLGYKGGFSSFGEQNDCDNCNVTFYYDGLKEVELPDEYKYYCDCCYLALSAIVYGSKD
jgi:hypothetical protein